MRRRLVTGILALAALGLATASGAVAQGYGGDAGTMPAVPGAGAGLGQAMPGTGMGPDGAGMAQGGPAMGAGPGYGTPLSGVGGTTVSPTARTDHPGDNGWGAPCVGCRMMVDLCEEVARCQSLAGAFHPEIIGLHSTVIHANLTLYFPGGPLTCVRPRLAGPPVCVDVVGDGDWGRPGGTAGMNH